MTLQMLNQNDEQCKDAKRLIAWIEDGVMATIEKGYLKKVSETQFSGTLQCHCPHTTHILSQVISNDMAVPHLHQHFSVLNLSATRLCCALLAPWCSSSLASLRMSRARVCWRSTCLVSHMTMRVECAWSWR
jgi:hypothetical protein